ncbi:glycoside hydrolase family 97 protein [Ferruginibacter lapsinanis]|uniref:glycoside hydrolase family 97 protein n=1 Tax=Ferruginibacter lapsinanis TaxID=563172 RepID=UPI001E43A8ED|nr:glycoside hydrolase family 97 protein [Ferruginibacter lapsinanis]UEG48564.1 glycoside hydrolase family 97 protein [Ferruginibacter lapsinanis]
MLTQRLLILLVTFITSINVINAQAKKTTVNSPDKNIILSFWINEAGTPMYACTYKTKDVILPSGMGFTIKENFSKTFLPSLRFNLAVIKTEQQSVDEKWQPVWGEVKEIRDNYNQLTVHLTQTNSTPVLMDIVFKVFNDGVGFRYEFPQQKNLNHFTIADEYTEFHLTGNHKAFWIPGDYDSNEFNPETTNLSEVDASKSLAYNQINARAFFDSNAVQTPLMLKSSDGLYINIHEAALVNYPAMNLHLDKTSYTLSSRLVPDAIGNKAYLQAPAKTPWRTIIVSDKATDIIASKLILNLNEPSVIKDPSWIKPQKFIGVWWEMHVGKSSWDRASGKHAANTANVKKYIDFAAKYGFSGVLVEGWNVGWEDWFGQWKENVFDFVTPYPDFDVKELHRYAAEKGVKMIMHHETSSSVTNYERQMDTAYRFMKENGYDAVKTGYVGKIIPRGEYHDGQWMVNHYVRVAKKTADYKIMLDAHEAVRPTGLSRTYPNWMACEAARGMEFNAWSTGNNPDHETIFPFTRFMGGPMDYTPGIFELKMVHWDSTKANNFVHTTLAKQLALYVTICSPMQMAADLPESYESRLDAFQFIRDVAVDWDDSKYLEAEPGDYITVARKAKGTNKWFIGAITDENKRSTTIKLDFLDANKKYLATIYADAKDAHWKDNPQPYEITTQVVTSKSQLKLQLAPGGGCAISLFPIE